MWNIFVAKSKTIPSLVVTSCCSQIGFPAFTTKSGFYIKGELGIGLKNDSNRLRLSKKHAIFNRFLHQSETEVD